MFDPQDDPLGLALMSRARARRQAQDTNNPAAQTYMSGPLPDQNWDAFFQAVNEANPGKSVNFLGDGPPGGHADPNTADAGTLFADHSRQIRGLPFAGNVLLGDQGSHGQNALAALQGLRRASRQRAVQTKLNTFDTETF